MERSIEFLVVRASLSELTFARITAMVADENLTREYAFLGALKGALTKWVQNSDAGKKAWADSSKDFNVGDLAGELGEESLEPFLGEAGIRNLKICIEINGNRCGWSYDTVLMDREALEEKRA